MLQFNLNITKYYLKKGVKTMQFSKLTVLLSLIVASICSAVNAVPERVEHWETTIAALRHYGIKDDSEQMRWAQHNLHRAQTETRVGRLAGVAAARRVAAHRRGAAVAKAETKKAAKPAKQKKEAKKAKTKKKKTGTKKS